MKPGSSEQQVVEAAREERRAREQHARTAPTWATTSPLRTRAWPVPPTTPPASSLRVPATPDRVAWMAGAMPKSSAVAIDRAEREGHHAQMGSDESVTDPSLAPGREPIEQRAGPRRDDQPERSARERQHEALGELLADDPHAAGAERETDRDLLVTRRRAREQQVRHVRAGDHAAGDRPWPSGRSAASENRRRMSDSPFWPGISTSALAEEARSGTVRWRRCIP